MSETPAQSDDDLLKRAIAAHAGDLGKAIGALFIEMQNRLVDVEARLEALEVRRKK